MTEGIEQGKETKICRVHEGRQRSYCEICKTLLCENCSSSHESHHEITDIVSIIIKQKDAIYHYNSKLTKEIAEALWKVNRYQKVVYNAIEKEVLSVENYLVDFLKTTRKKMFEYRDSIYRRIEKYIKEIEAKGMPNYYEEELEGMDKMIECTDNEDFHIPDEKYLQNKYSKKKEEIRSLLNETSNIHTEVDLLLDDFRGLQDTFKISEKTSLLELEKICRKTLFDSKKCIEELKENQNRTLFQSKYNMQLLSECNSLSLEKKRLIETIDDLTGEKEDLESKTKGLKNMCNDLQSKKEALDIDIKDKTKEIENLDNIIKNKQDLSKKIGNNFGGTLLTPKAEDIAFQEADLLMQASILFVFDQRASSLFVCHFDFKQIAKINAVDYMINSNCGIAQLRNDFFISGGFDTFNVKFQKNTVKLHFTGITEIKGDVKADMILEKSQHKLVLLNVDTMYSIGGKSKDRKFLTQCEKYEISKDRWELAPSLNEGKLNVGATAVNGTTIYAFGGFKGSHVGTIECLNTLGTKKAWKIIKPANSIWTPRDEVACYQSSKNEITIFGGIDSSGGCTDDVFEFNIETCIMKKAASKLYRKEWFSASVPIKLRDGSICVSGFFESGIHIYNEKTGWNMVPLKDWKMST